MAALDCAGVARHGGGGGGPTRRPVRRVLAVIVAAGALTACGDDGNGDGDGAAPTDGNGESPGQELFVSGTSPSCGSCHVLEDAGTDGTTGPSLDQVQPSAEQVRNAISSGPGLMPVLDDQLSGEEIDTLSEYVADAAG